MRPPSLLCLRALRSIVLQDHHQPCVHLTRRLASTAAEPKRRPPPPKAAEPAFRPPPSSPGYKLRQAGNEEKGFTPTPLSRPIGMPNPPRAGENMGLDKRSLQQRRDDFVNYDKHLQRRAQMTQQIAKPYFRDWSNLRFHEGKQFYANDRLFRAEHALFIPNFYGKTLRKDNQRIDRKDGYKGLGRNTCDVMFGKVSILSIASNAWAEAQVKTFLSKEANPELQEILDKHKDQAQIVEINREENALKWWLVQAFAPGLRKTRTLEEQARYFMVYRGINDILKEAIGLINDKVGYVYLVDQQCRLRWAGNANALPNEIESLNRGLQKLIRESETPNEQAPVVRLEDAVAGVIH